MSQLNIVYRLKQLYLQYNPDLVYKYKDKVQSSHITIFCLLPPVSQEYKLYLGHSKPLHKGRICPHPGYKALWPKPLPLWKRNHTSTYFMMLVWILDNEAGGKEQVTPKLVLGLEDFFVLYTLWTFNYSIMS